MKNRTRLWLMVLVVALVANLFTVGAFAEATSGSCGSNLTWTVNTETGELTISGTGAMNDYSSTTAPWSAYNDVITEVTVGEGVTSLGAKGSLPFNGFTKNFTVSLPSTLTAIDSQMKGNAKLVAVTFPDSGALKNIYDWSFSGCTALTYIKLPETEGTDIWNGAFNNCKALTEIVLPASVKTVGKANGSAFSGSCAPAKITFLGMSTSILPDSASGLPTSATIYGFAESTAEAYATKYGRNFVEVKAGQIAEGTIGTNLTWTLSSDGILTISGEGKMASAWNIAEYNDKVTKVVVEEGVTALVSKAFNSLTQNFTIELPSSLEKIDGDFNSCTKLTAVTFAETGKLATIYAWSFSGCSALESVVLPDNTATKILGSAFNNCRKLTSISLGDKTVSIAGKAFNNCEKLAEILIPGSVISVGDATDTAFTGCNALEKVTFLGVGTEILPGNETAIPETAVIYGSSGSTAETYANSYGRTFFDQGAVATGSCGTNLVWSLSEGGELTISGTGAMNDYSSSTAPWGADAYKDKITKVTIKEGVTVLCKKAFKDLTQEFTISLPGTLEKIDGDFNGCTKLTSVTFAKEGNLKVIYAWSFSGCSALTSVTLPDNVKTEIRNNAFNKCGALTNLTLGNQTSLIYGSAFYNCTSLASTVVIPASVVSLGDVTNGSAFTGCSNLTAVAFLSSDTEIIGGLPSGVTTIFGYEGSAAEAYAEEKGQTFFSLDNEVTIEDAGACGPSLLWVLSPENHLFVMGAGNMFNYSASNPSPWSEYNADIAKITVEEGVHTIGMQAFNQCAVKEIVLPESLSGIEEYAFRYCSSLTEITIPGGVKYIKRYAFNACSGLATVTFSEGLQTIDYYAFNNCASLSGTLVIPASVIALGTDQGSAFNGCRGLTAITFLSPKTKIAGDLPSAITTIHGYEGSAAEQYADEKGLSFVSFGDAPFAYDCTTVFELVVGAMKAPAGDYLSVVALERMDLVDKETLKFLVVDEFGALYICTADGDVEALLDGSGEAIAVVDETLVSIVYNDASGEARFYINQSIPYYGMDAKLAINVPVANEAFRAVSPITEKLILADGVEKRNQFTANDAPATYAGFQVDDNGTAIRVLAGIDSLYYDSVGFVLELYSNDIIQGTVTQTINTVFYSINANNETVTASELGFNYITAVIISNIDRTEYPMDANVYFKITPFSTLGGEKIYGRHAYITITYDYEEQEHIFVSGITEPFVPTLRFVATGDIHFNNSVGVNASNFKSIIEQIAVLAEDENSNNGYVGLDAVLLAGDITNAGTAYQVDIAKNYLETSIPEGTELVITMGNHDWNDSDVIGAARSLAQFEAAFGEMTKDTVIGGYHFITICCDAVNGERGRADFGWDYSGETLEKAEALIKAALADTGPNKPIFVIQHIPNAGTVAGADLETPCSTLEELESQYSNLIVIAGHSHFPVDDECSIHQKHYTTIGTGTLNTPMAHVVEVDKYDRVRIRQYDAATGSFVGEPWMIDSYDPRHFTYTEDRFEDADLFFAEGAEIDVSNVTPTSATIRFSSVPAESLTARAYKIVLSDAANNVVSTDFIETQYYGEKYVTDLAFVFEALESRTEYTVSVYAVNPLYSTKIDIENALTSTPLTAVFTTDGDSVINDSQN